MASRIAAPSAEEAADGAVEVLRPASSRSSQRLSITNMVDTALLAPPPTKSKPLIAATFSIAGSARSLVLDPLGHPLGARSVAPSGSSAWRR